MPTARPATAPASMSRCRRTSSATRSQRTGHKPRAGPARGRHDLPAAHRSRRAGDAAAPSSRAEILDFGYYHLWLAPGAGRHRRSSARRRNATRPEIEQIMIADRARRRASSAFERDLYLVPPPDREARDRRRRSRTSTSARCPAARSSTRACSSPSSSTAFYPDLQRRALRLARSRSSTSAIRPTPSRPWWLAQPFRMLAHNGEINTLSGNINWMKSHEIKMAVRRVRRARRGHQADDPGRRRRIRPRSTRCSRCWCRAGRDAPMAKTHAGAGSAGDDSRPCRRRIATCTPICNAVMEPWDGPAALAHDRRPLGGRPAWTATGCARMRYAHHRGRPADRRVGDRHGRRARRADDRREGPARARAR